MDSEAAKYTSLIKEATKKSKCSLCGSESYGKGCIYSATGLHLHLDDPKKCAWCGSSNTIGKGCPYSPTGFHGVGANLYTSMVAESLLTGFLLRMLHKPFTETTAYNNGIVSESGNLVKTPTTDEEIRSYTPFDSFLFKLKRILGEKVNLLRENLLLELTNKTITDNMSVADFEKELELKRKLETVSRDFYDIISEAENDNLPSTIIEKSIVESFLNDKY